MAELPIDHDRLFKELITTLFVEFLELFAPQMAAAIDRDSIEFIDKEVFSDLVLGDENVVDILAKVRIAGQEQFILIHIENQSTSEASFTERMFEYFYLLRAKFRLPIYPIAVFSFDDPQRPEPNIYSEVTFGMEVVRYQFQPIQLNKMQWRNYLGGSNPIATALMAKMNVAEADRHALRREALRVFATLKLEGKRLRVIKEFMDTYLKTTTEDMKRLLEEIKTIMPPQEQKQYQVYVDPLETYFREVYMTKGLEEGRQLGIAQGIEEGIAQGIEEGIEQGIEQGLHNGLIRVSLRQLQSKFGVINEMLQQRICALPTPKLDELAVALLGFGAIDDLDEWLDANA